MAQIRIATRAWDRAEPATEMGSNVVGLGVAWVEVDGCRIADVLGASVTMNRDGFMDVSVSAFGPVEIVYLDADGNEIGTAPMTYSGDIDGHTIVDPRPVTAETGG